MVPDAPRISSPDPVPRRTLLDRENEQTAGLRYQQRSAGDEDFGSYQADGDGFSGVRWNRVNQVLSAVAGNWNVPILRHLAKGVTRPSDLLDAINVELRAEQDALRPGEAGAAEGEGLLARKVMFDTLKRLVAQGLAVRRLAAGYPKRTHYYLTLRGREILETVSKLDPPESRWPMRNGYADPHPPPGVDTSIPNPARMWNVTIGGKNNFAADREANAAVLRAMPTLEITARLTRRFQADAVRMLIGLGVRQFLDIGTGLPVDGAVHEVAQMPAPESRVVYVDNDPVVMAHARALLTSTPQGRCDFVHADLRESEKIIAHAAGTLDFTQPVAVIMLMVLHFIPDQDDPADIIRRLLDGIHATSYLVMGHAASDTDPSAAADAATRYNEKSPTHVRLRSHAEVERLFSAVGAELLEPGLVTLSDWWPEDDSVPPGVNGHIGIGRRIPQTGYGSRDRDTA